MDFNLEYDFWKYFILKADYLLEKYTNKSQNSSNKNDFLNATLNYQKDNSLWGFEISVNNLLDTTFKVNSSFSDFLISENRTFVLPRIIMLKVSYKLD